MPDFTYHRNRAQGMKLYRGIFEPILYFGLILFFCGIFIYPNNSGTQQTFYLLVVIPFLFLIPFTYRDLPWSSYLFWVYLTFPLYMFLSHFWAPEENITRNWLFFFRQIICFFIFIASLYLAVKNSQKFISVLLICLLFSGFISGLISIAQHIIIHDDFFLYQLRGFSIDDIDKAGGLHVIHLGLCLYFIAKEFSELNGSGKKGFLFGVMATVSLATIVLTKTDGTWLAVGLFPVLLSMYYVGRRKVSMALAVLGLLCPAMIYMFGMFDEVLAFRNVSVRFELAIAAISQVGDNILTGLGLTYKLPVHEALTNRVQPHPHNMVLDTYRFGGLIGLGLLVAHIYFPLEKLRDLIERRLDVTFLVSWLICGVYLGSIYGQQPIVRPGGYMWFFYWLPITLLAVLAIQHSEKKLESDVAG